MGQSVFTIPNVDRVVFDTLSLLLLLFPLMMCFTIRTSVPAWLAQSVAFSTVRSLAAPSARPSTLDTLSRWLLVVVHCCYSITTATTGGSDGAARRPRQFASHDYGHANQPVVVTVVMFGGGASKSVASIAPTKAADRPTDRRTSRAAGRAANRLGGRPTTRWSQRPEETQRQENHQHRPVDLAD